MDFDAFVQLKEISVKASSEIQKPLVVCSHERSGTHFLMNSIGVNTPYCEYPFLSLNPTPLGSIVNFFCPNSVAHFFSSHLNLEKKGSKGKLSSIVKAHYLPQVFEKTFEENLSLFVYIYRNPKDCLLSFWRYIQRWDWHEGLKAETPLEFASSAPEGQILYYQPRQIATHFIRWAQHVESWLEAEERFDCIKCIRFEDLKKHFNPTLREVIQFLNQPIPSSIRSPSENQFIHGEHKPCSHSNLQALETYCKEELKAFPRLNAIYGDKEKPN